MTLRRPSAALTLDDLITFLAIRGVGKEHFPEHLFVVAEMPISPGGKIAKQHLKALIRGQGAGHQDVVDVLAVEEELPVQDPFDHETA